jgi:hypothetical protein
VLVGWLKLHRKLLESEIFKNEKLLKTFIWCILKASHKEREQLVGHQKELLSPGQFVTGRKKAGLELGFSPSTAWSYLNLLKRNNNIDIKSNSKYSVITIINWDLYQSESEKADNKTDSNSDNKLTTNEQQTDTNKNVKNYKNNKDIYNRIFEHYKSLDLISHRKFTPAMKTAIDKAMRENSYSVEDCIDLLSRHQEVVNLTSRNDNPVRARPLYEFFGQKAYNATHLICVDYEEGGKYYEQYLRRPSKVVQIKKWAVDSS